MPDHTAPTLAAKPHIAAQIAYMGFNHDVLSLDLNEYGALIVAKDGSVQLLPWHTITGIEFLDDSAFQTDADDGLPNGHEGSE